MTIEKVSVKSTKKTDKSKGKTKAKAKAKATAKTGNIKVKTGKVEQNVNVNVTAPPKRKYAKRAIKNIEPVPKFIDRPEIVNISGRVPLVNSSNNINPVDRNIQANPVRYLESSIPPADHTKAFVKVKKGQNPYDVETELQHEIFEVNPTEKGRGLAENVEQQTRVKIKVDKPKRSDKKLVLEPQTQFVQTVAGNTNKVDAFDDQAEGTFTENAEEGMTIIDKPTKSKGRPKKYLTEEEEQARIDTLAAAAERRAEAEAKKAAKKMEAEAKKDAKKAEAEAKKEAAKLKELDDKRAALIAEAEAERRGEEIGSVKEKIAAINKKLETQTDPKLLREKIKLTTEAPYYAKPPMTEGQKEMLKTYQTLPPERRRRSIFLEGESYLDNNFEDRSLARFINTNDNPSDSNVELVVAGQDTQNYSFL